MRTFAPLVLAAVPLAAQTLEVRSEFLRPGPFGNTVTSDATARPREILSPGVVRNGYASYHLVVRGAPMNYFLFAATNPPVVRLALYKEEFVKVGDAWIPDPLVPVRRMPEFGVIPDPEAVIPHQTARAYLLEVWVPPETTPGGLRLEVQLKSGGWTVWPMEIRVLRARVPDVRVPVTSALPAISEPSDEAAMTVLLDHLGKPGPRQSPAAQTVPASLREVIRRNAGQDLALAESLDQKVLGAALRTALDKAPRGGEWYLSVRDLIYRLASK